MIIGNAYAESVVGPLERAMAHECEAIAREFPGWQITWTAPHGYRAVRGEDVIGPCTSRTALRCQLAVAEHRMAR